MAASATSRSHRCGHRTLLGPRISKYRLLLPPSESLNVIIYRFNKEARVGLKTVQYNRFSMCWYPFVILCVYAVHRKALL